jgi:Fe-S cluster biogenesis protein NfuA/nitrite reductase/ring-hydroxylating ferredoxin subunit
MNNTLPPPLAPTLVGGERSPNQPKSAGPTPNDINREGKRIKELIDRIENLPDAEARGLLRECLQSVLALHGNGLAHMLDLVRNAGAAGGEVTEALFKDKLVNGLLLIHGLHPVPLEKRLEQALEKVRPYAKSHGGNVELVRLENDVAVLRLEGTCKSCPSSAVTMELAVRQAIEEACPDLLGFEVEGNLAASPRPEHVPGAAPVWVEVKGLGTLPDGEFNTREINGGSVVFAKSDGQLYAYRNCCPGCQTTFDHGRLESDLLVCSGGHRFEIRRAGQCPDEMALHLDPVPLLSANGAVKISLR